MSLSLTIRDIHVPLSEYPHLAETVSLRDAFTLLPAGWTSGRRYRHVLVLKADRQLMGLMGMPIPVNPY